MTGYGLIAAVPAFTQYKKAINHYNNLVEHQEALVTAVGTYNFHKMDDYYLSHLTNEKQDNPVPGLLIAPMLRVGALVGKLYRCQASVVMTNTSDRAIEFSPGFSIENVLCDEPVKVYKVEWGGFWHFMDFNEIPIPQKTTKPFRIKPGQTLELMITGGISGMDGDKLENVRQMIYAATGVGIITSCPKVSIENGVRTDVRFHWYYVDDIHDGIAWNKKEYYGVGLQGILRYCGEVYWPEEVNT